MKMRRLRSIFIKIKFMIKKSIIYLFVFLFFIYFLSNNFLFNKEKCFNSVYCVEKNFNILENSKLTFPNSHVIVANYGDVIHFKSDFFYLDNNWIINFILNKKKWEWKIRNELRVWVNWRDEWWDISNKKLHYFLSEVKLEKISNLDEYTFLQIHSEKNPLLRILVKKREKLKRKSYLGCDKNKYK